MQKSSTKQQQTKSNNIYRESHIMTKCGVFHACKVVSTYENQLMSYTRAKEQKPHDLKQALKKALDKTQHSFMINTMNKLEIENIINSKKDI